MSLNIAVVGRGFVTWGGGIDFLRLVLNGLLAAQCGSSIFLLLPRPTLKERLIRGARDRIAQLIHRPTAGRRCFTESELTDALAGHASGVQVIFFDDTDRHLLKTLREVQADIVLPFMHSLGKRFPIPWIGYIGDFQHRHLPQLFNPLERLVRERTFAALVADAPSVIVNARAVEADVRAFFPEARATIVPLPFAPVAQVEWLSYDPAAAQDKYHIKRRYFIVCNQFWVHKDHETAFRAHASFLSRMGQDVGEVVDLVCTGTMYDYRAPGHVRALLELPARLGTSGNVHLLGHVPKHDQVSLLRGAIAVIQPTLCEGGPGGGAIYEAVALGIPGIVSDIAVNREIDVSGVRFFKAGCADDLARRMIEVLRDPAPAIGHSELLDRSRARLSGFGEALGRAIAAANV